MEENKNLKSAVEPNEIVDHFLKQEPKNHCNPHTETSVVKRKTEQIKSWVTKNKKLLIGVVLSVVVITIILSICLNTCTYHGIKPELDLKDAERNLEDNDYYVTITDDKDDLAPGIEEELSAKSNDYDDYIVIVVYEDAAYAKIVYKHLKHLIESEIEELKIQIKTIEYALKHYDNDLTSKEIDELEDELKELKEELENCEETYIYGRSGNVVWYGTTNAAEDSKD